MMDVVAFYGARAGVVALNNIAGLADQHVTVQGNNIIVPTQCNKIAGLYCCSQATAGSLTNRIVVQSPSLLSTSPIEVCNWNANGAVVAAAQIPDNNAPYEDFTGSPIELVPGEALTALSAVDVAAVAENIYCLVFLTDGVLAVPLTGRVESIAFDTVAAPVAATWTATALNSRTPLRAGTYAVVGMRPSGLSMIAARLIFGNQGARPGALATNSATGAAATSSFSDAVDQFNGKFRYGRFGVLGTFSHMNPPQMEMLCSVADAATNNHVVLDLMKIA